MRELKKPIQEQKASDELLFHCETADCSGCQTATCNKDCTGAYEGNTSSSEDEDILF